MTRSITQALLHEPQVVPPTARACCCAPASIATVGEHPATTDAGIVQRVGIFLYGLLSYAVFLASFLYALGFVGNIVVPTALDKIPADHAGMHWATAAAVNVVLLLVFAIQHSVMARPWFKTRWTQVVPEPAERSTYVLLSSLALIAMMLFWQPIGGVVWNVEQPIARWSLWALMSAGWLLVLAATFMINHFDLFGLRQVWLFLLKKPYTHLPFKTPGLYSRVRHPLYVGWLIAFWATPTMTSAHLLFAVITTAYILAAIRWEERDLQSMHGRAYDEYRRRVPKLIPRFRSVAPSDQTAS
ncbi:MAG: isoprenylcysteine carboxylmethyltransferase family protein [Planctomycetes bacterium]|nr:isoprenylcysteine carboxylmethyltransferase family protein [Planctomycetota bacterium]